MLRIRWAAICIPKTLSIIPTKRTTPRAVKSFFFVLLLFLTNSMLPSSIFAMLMASCCLENDPHSMESFLADPVPDLITLENDDNENDEHENEHEHEHEHEHESIEPVGPSSELSAEVIKMNIPKLNLSREMQEKARLIYENKYMKQALLAFEEREY